MTYKVVIWCPDCTGQDFEGCFDGGTEWETFNTLREAEIFVEKRTRDSIYLYEIIELK